MLLFTKDINQKLFSQYKIGSDLNKQKVVAKIFNPYGRGRWYLLNSDPQDPDFIWAIVQMGDIVEIGSVSRSELETTRIKPHGLPLERDMYFSDRNAMQVLEGLENGKTFANGGMTPGHWYKDNTGTELRFIGKDSGGNLLFNNGEKIITKSEDDFEEDIKETKLFKFFDDGGEMDEGVDLFEDYDDIPNNVKKILQKYDFEEGDYRTLEKAKKDVEKVGYTFEYSLDGTAYDLRKIGQKGKNEDDYADGGMMAKGGMVEIGSEGMYRGGAAKVLKYDDKNKMYAIKYLNEDGEIDGDFVMARKDDFEYGFSDFNPKMAMGGNTEKAFQVILKNPNGGMTEKAILLAKTKEDASKKALNLKEYKQYGYVVKSSEEIKYAMGGTTKFKDKVQSIKDSLLKRKKVSPKVQKDYGKTYSPKEAEDSAKRIVGSMVKKGIK